MKDLLKVKSIVTILLTIVFSILALKGKVEAKDFVIIFNTIIAFYFGTQHEKKNGNTKN